MSATGVGSIVLSLAGPPGVLLRGARHPLAALDSALLAWLALEGPTPRARLAQLLWPDKEGQAARNSLRQRLFQLRKMVGAELVQGSTTLALAPGVTHDLDDADSVLGEATGEDLAPGEFAHWLEQQRARRRDRLRRSTVELCEMAAAAKDWDDALGHARELLALEPLSEEAHRRVMRLHYLAGDRAAALLAFDRCEQTLKDEVGARPSGQTLELLHTVEQAATARGAALPLAQQPPAAVLRPPRLVGREAERQSLAQGFAAAQVVALIGEAGMGKTRLLQEFMLTQPGLVRAAGRPGDAGVPLATLARLLRAVMDEPCGQTAAALESATRSELARVLPELEPVAQRAGGEGQRLMMERAIRALLATRAGLRGLVVDDLHFADEASLELLAALIDDDAASQGTLRWILAYRPAESGSPVRALHDALVDEARLLPLPLAPLSRAALVELVDSLGLPGVRGQVLADGLLQRTGGNPLFVLETLKQAWVERTLADLADARSLPRPLSVGRLIERRIAQLSPPALALARVASIAGVDFSIALAESVLGVSAMQFADALNELESAQVLRQTQFAHDLVFDAVRGSVPLAVARHTHAGVAAWLEAHAGEPARIARHWVEGAQPGRALPWLERAAQAAAVAVRRKEQASFLLEKGAIESALDDRSAAFESSMQAAELLVTLDHDGGGQGDELCDRLDALAATPSERVRACTQRASLALQRGDPAGAEAMAAQALRDALRHGVAPSIVIECRQHLATALGMLERLPDAIAQFEAMLGWIDEHGGDERRCEFHGNLAMVYDQAGRLSDAQPHHELAIDLARRTHHHGNLLQTICNFACNRILGGQIAQGAVLLARARQHSLRDDSASSVDGFIAMNQAICDYQSGRYREALAALDEGLDRFARFAPGFRKFAQVHLAVCWSHLGQWTRVAQAIEAADDSAELPPSSRCRLLMLRHAHAHALGQRAPDADALRAMQATMGASPDIVHAAMLLGASALPPGEGRGECERVIEAAARLGHEGTLLAAHAQAARCAAFAGDRAGALGHVEAMQALALRATPVRQYAMEPWLDAACALARLGEPAPARALVRHACDWIEAAAAQHVAPEFRDSFLYRNPVNRELLALASRFASTGTP